MRELKVQAEIPASPERVWAVYTDHRGWVKWAGVREVVLRQEGEPPPDGLGATRVIRTAGLAIEEEVIAFEPPKRMVYRLVAGLPIRNHQGEVLFEATGRGTRVLWRVRFDPLLPGTGGLLVWALRRALGDVLARLSAVLLAPERR